MVNYLHPGVYPVEVPGARSIQSASTSVAAFVGVAEAGPVNEPTLITSWNAFTRQFGAFIWGAFMPWAVYEFFLEGGSACWIVRTDSSGAKAATASLGGTTLAAASGGIWGNNLQAMVRNAVATNPTTATAPVFTLDVVVDATVIDGTNGQAPDPAKTPQGTQMLIAYVRQNGLTATAVGSKSFYTLESFSGLTDTGAGFVGRINANSMFIRVAKADGARPANTNAPVPFTTGASVTLDLDKSYGTLAAVQGVSLLAIPDSVAITTTEGMLDSADQAALINRGLNFCQAQTSLFYVIDPPWGQSVQSIAAFKAGSASSPALNSSYGALYYPWVWIYNPIARGKVPIPASGPVLGRYAYTDANVGVFKSPAGVNDGALRTVVSVATQLTDADQDIINPNGIDAIRSLINYGNVIWGARTVSQDTQWTYVSVRRLFIYVEQSLKNSLQWVVFEPNDQQLWSSVTRDIAAFLTLLWQQGGLFGASADEAFFVTCDESNNPPDARAQGILTIDIGLAPVYPAEFVILRITQKTAGPDSGS